MPGFSGAMSPWRLHRIGSFSRSGARPFLRTAPAGRRNGKMRYDRRQNISVLAGELTRAVLTGTRLPASLLNLLLQRNPQRPRAGPHQDLPDQGGLIVRDLRSRPALAPTPPTAPRWRITSCVQTRTTRTRSAVWTTFRPDRARFKRRPLWLTGSMRTVADICFWAPPVRHQNGYFPPTSVAAKDRHPQAPAQWPFTEAHTGIRDPAHARRLAEGLERE